jgi:hypothetical protein
MPPSKYRNKEARNQRKYLEPDLYPVLDRLGISMSNQIRPVYKPVQPIAVGHIPGFSLDKATPQLAPKHDAQIDRDDAGDDFIKKKLHSNSLRALLPAMLSTHLGKEPIEDF